MVSILITVRIGAEWYNFIVISAVTVVIATTELAQNANRLSLHWLPTNRRFMCENGNLFFEFIIFLLFIYFRQHGP